MGIVSGLIHDHFKSLHGGSVFQSAILPPTPIVSTTQAFDDLLVPKNHILRSASDTYYVTPDTVLRPHGTSHQRGILGSLRAENKEGKIWTCDVYRKDEVDRIHFPVFHQTDGVRVFEKSASESAVVDDLKNSLKGLMRRLFEEAGRKLVLRWDETATFPFTHPSIEMEIQLQSGPHEEPVWVECLGCGKIRTEIDDNGWAFGIGIDRLAMLLFEIDDIRTLWSLDPRFTDQFTENKISKFKPFSKYPATYRDTAFWVTKEVDLKKFEFEVMQLAGPLGLETMHLIDSFAHPKTGKKSLCLRFTYRGIERTLTSEECNEIHNLVNQYVTGVAEGVIRT